jgi:hypothetical protein
MCYHMLYDWCSRILFLRSSNPRRPRKTRAENWSNHSLAPANFHQKASCVSQIRHPSSHLVLLRPGHGGLEADRVFGALEAPWPAAFVSIMGKTETAHARWLCTYTCLAKV